MFTSSGEPKQQQLPSHVLLQLTRDTHCSRAYHLVVMFEFLHGIGKSYPGGREMLCNIQRALLCCHGNDYCNTQGIYPPLPPWPQS